MTKGAAHGFARPFASAASPKDGRHGLPLSRSESGDDPGTTPPRAAPAPTGSAQKRDDETHRLVNLQLGRVTDRGPHQGKAAEGGLSARLRGKRLATDKGHRVDTDQEA